MIKINSNRCLITSWKFKCVCVMRGDFVWKGSYGDYLSEVVSSEGTFEVGAHSEKEQEEIRKAAVDSGIMVGKLGTCPPEFPDIDTVWVNFDDYMTPISFYRYSVTLLFPEHSEVLSEFLRRLREECGFKLLYRINGPWKAVL